MLGKLMKYEWKSTWKLLVPANLLVIVMTFFACVTVRLEVFHNISSDGAVYASLIVMMTYILSMFVAVVGTVVYLVQHFYTSTYGDQGYLLHTLPVDKHHIIIAKVLVSFVWVLLSSFLVYISVFLLLGMEEDIFSVLVEMMKITVIGRAEGSVAALTVIMTIITLIVGMLARILKVTACISLGQLSSNHKLLVAFAYYFGIYIIQRTINIFYYLFLGLIWERTDDVRLSGSWEFLLIIDLIYCVVFYLLTWHVMDKKLNLE